MIELEHIQPGEQVAQFHHCAHLGDRFTLESVTRATKTQIVIGQFRFRRKDGYEVGKSSYRSDRIFPATGATIRKMHERIESDRLERRRNALSVKLHRVIWRRLGVEQLEAVCEVLGMEAGE